MVFHLVAVGRLKNADLQSACDDYRNRIRRYAKFSIRELPGSRSTRDAGQVLETERSQILPAIEQFPNRILLSRDGVSCTSRDLAKRIDGWRERAQDTVFIIGGAYGVHNDVHDTARERISLSPMTFPHELARVLWLEQLYRGFTILSGEPYHKGA